MAKDAVIFIQNPDEPLKATNGRIREACMDTNVTGAHLVVINGRAVISLISETEEIAEEELAELQAVAATGTTPESRPKGQHSDEEIEDARAELKELKADGFQVPVNEPLVVVVKRLLLRAVDEDKARKIKPLTAGEACVLTENNLNDMLDKADGSVDSLQFAECNVTHEAYVLVSFQRDAEVHAAESSKE